MILIIDNYDSFTWNLVQRIGELDSALAVRVERNDQITVEAIKALAPSRIIISPGPCTPNEAGVSNEVVQAFAGKTPVLGVCLGHQCIAAVFGMRVERHAKIMHGKTSPIHHDHEGVYDGLPDPFVATRYHSLVVARETVPTAGWKIASWTTDELATGACVKVVMGLRRAWTTEERAKGLSAPLEGVQFHPESFLTDAGHSLLANFLGITGAAPVTTRCAAAPS